MKLFTLPLLALTLFLNSCGNDVEEIKNPSTGKLLKRYEYYTDDSGQKIKDGEYIEWDAAGEKIAELHYQDDSLHGTCEYYYEDGSIGSYTYNLGKLDGEQSLKASDGNLLSKENYKDGKLDGQQLYYSDKGKLIQKAFYKKGRPIGKWDFFVPELKEHFSLTFKNEVCQEFIGTWNVSEERETSMIFGKNGSFQLWAPYFDHYGEAVLRVDGKFSVDKSLHAIHKNGITLDYEIFYVSPDRIILLSPSSESPALTELIRVK